MKSSLSWKEYQQLELIAPERPTFKQRCQRFWRSFVADLRGSGEPRLWQSCDRHGQILWNGYDPTTGRSVQGVSEADMLTWLEQRHYGRHDFDQPTLPPARRSPFQIKMHG